MGGFFGITSKKDCMFDVFFGTDYHSHLGTCRGGVAVWDKDVGLQRKIHNIQNSPFRTKFEHVFEEMKGTSAIGCISDYDPQPLLIRSKHGTYAIAMIGAIKNAEQLIEEFVKTQGGHFCSRTEGRINEVELLASLINSKESFAEGIKYAQSKVQGSASVLIMTSTGSLIAGRDRVGRIPVEIGKNKDGYSVAFESFAYKKLGYKSIKELGPGEIVEITPDGITELVPAGKEMKMCAFLWSYYGYPTSTYEGVNVEMMRYKNGHIMAKSDQERGLIEDIDYVGGVPDSGTPHAIGYANESKLPFARAFIKYTPTWARSFTPTKQTERKKVAKMKQISVDELISGKKLLFVDDSIVRGTQLKETVDFLYESGAKAVHMRSACPPIMYGCKYLNFTRSSSDMELIARRIIHELEGEEGAKHIDEYSDFNTERGKKLRESICKELHLASLEFQSLDGIIEAIGLEPCKLCTYCWTGKE
ncbi:MAG: amidophosphoribosyltransferase [Clostridia bacterium]|nr:amidophosphoribosyltransferase [Clostridia bacterium]